MTDRPMVVHLVVQRTFLILLGVIAVVAMIAGTILAITGYSSAGAFAIGSACVGVLGTLAAGASGTTMHPGPPDS